MAVPEISGVFNVQRAAVGVVGGNIYTISALSGEDEPPSFPGAVYHRGARL